MGDFNDNLWDASNKRARIWERELQAGTMLDPVPLLPEAVEQHQATRKTTRIDGILLGQTLWRSSPALDHHTQHIERGLDHKMVVYRLQLSLLDETPPTLYPSISHWNTADLRHFTVHMQRWFTVQPTAPIPVMVQAVEEEVARYVSSRSRTPLKDEVDAQLLSETVAQPDNSKAKKKYLDNVAKQARQKAQNN